MPELAHIRPTPDQREAVRLTLKACHIPIGTILIGSLVAASVLSTVFTIVAYGPAQPLP